MEGAKLTWRGQIGYDLGWDMDGMDHHPVGGKERMDFDFILPCKQLREDG